MKSAAEVSVEKAENALVADFFIRGKAVKGGAVRHRSRDLGVDFLTPEIRLNELVSSRFEAPPLLDVPMAEIIRFLIACGERMNLDSNPHLQEAMERTLATNPLPRRVVENLFRSAPGFLSEPMLRASIDSNFSDPAVLDGWVEREDVLGHKGSIRAFPPRIIHMLAGNSPTGCIASIVQGVLVKAINVFKMPSSDPFTCVAILKTMAEVDPDHPVVKSLSAVYWRGGEKNVEQTLYRPQYFDRIVAWGGGEAINNVIGYLGPGLQLVSFDPKTSISIIGKEGFESKSTIDEVAEAAAEDITVFNQEACLASRFIFVEGDRSGVEDFCARLQQRLSVDRELASEYAPPPPADVLEQVEMLKLMGDGGVMVWGKGDGRGMVILTEEPVDFHPSNKTVNVVHLKSVNEAIRFVNVATQTIGIYPPSCKSALRTELAVAGAQRVVRLGGANKHVIGSPHDAMFPLQRLVHWMSDEDVG